MLLFCLLIYGAVHATSNDKPRPFEEIFPEIGYKTVEEALNDFEKHFIQSLKLPFRVPLIPFTHYFGRSNDIEGDINDSFKWNLLVINHLEINVRPIKHKIFYEGKYVLNTFELKKGNKATYMTISGFNVLAFEKR